MVVGGLSVGGDVAEDVEVAAGSASGVDVAVSMIGGATVGVGNTILVEVVAETRGWVAVASWLVSGAVPFSAPVLQATSRGNRRASRAARNL